MDTTTEVSSASQTARNTSFPIVGFGASAGGLEAFTQLLQHLPATTGMAYIVVQHMDPTHLSLLPELLARTTRMQVHEAREEMPIEANNVYIIAPNTDLTLEQSTLKTAPQTKTAGQHLSIDTFLSSLAKSSLHKAIGVILSGNASDGTRGLQAIKEFGGITLAQDVQSASASEMPQNAIASGCVDFIGSPEQIASELIRISRHPSIQQAHTTQTEKHANKEIKYDQVFAQILGLLRRTTDVDFTAYKSATLERRIVRRMVLQQVDSEDAYLVYLHNHPAEVTALFQDILIGVTNFFRSPSAYQALIDEVFPQLIATKSPSEALRIWVPGCSTGEEVYSLAICLEEFLSEHSLSIPFQIFGTDLNATAIEHARSGIYVPGVLGGLSPERLKRFFQFVGGSYQICKSIRACCVFAQHNLLKDPPFSRLDLLSCQNLLIYLAADTQKKIIQLFHYALTSHSFLLLGPSETIGMASDLFAHVGNYQQMYRKKITSARPQFVGPVSKSARNKPQVPPEEGNSMHLRYEEGAREVDIQKEADRLLLARYAPASVVIDAEMEILHFRGHTSPYLEPTAGKASLNLFKMAHESLGLELRVAISKAKKSGQPVKKEGIQMKVQGVLREIMVEVIPLQTSGTELHFMVIFEATSIPPGSLNIPTPTGALQTAKTVHGVKDRRIQRLEKDLVATREEMSSIIEEMEATNAARQSATEENLSSNEELRCLNEELETSKEEIQASNEELLVVNQELKQSNAQLNTAREYADAIVETIHEPLLVLDASLRVQSANQAFYQFFKAKPAETEHYHLFDLQNQQWNIPTLRTLLEELLPSNHAFTDYTMEGTFPRIGHKTMLLNAHRIDHVPLVLLAMADITTLTQAVKEKQQLLEQREDFMAIASHELKTPVTGIKGYTQLLYRRFHKAGDEQATSLLARMDARLDKLISLINTLLDVTKIEAGKLQWSTELFDLDILVQDIVEEIGHTTERNQIRIEGAIRTLVSGNPERIGQVLTNLLSNAIKYSPETETILVTLRAEKDAIIVSVQDFGIGIPLEKQAHLFERFFRASDPENIKVPGLGLGLYISAEIVKRHAGRMWVDSHPGLGSTFSFSIPYTPN